MYNIRYHLITIVSVFMALALGIFLGGMIVSGSEGFNSSDLVNSLKSDFAQLRAENSSLVDANKALEDFSETMTNQLVASKLDGMKVAVLGTNNRPTELARQSIERAGGTSIPVVVDSTLLESEFTGSFAQEIDRIKTAHAIESDTEAVAYGLATEWNVFFEGDRIVTDELVAKGVLSIPDYAKFSGVHGVVNVALSGEHADEFSLALSEQLHLAGMATLGLSVSGGNSTLARASFEKGISASNMLGSPIGTYSMVALLLGAEPGLYGSTNDAKTLFPEMPQGGFVLPTPPEVLTEVPSDPSAESK